MEDNSIRTFRDFLAFYNLMSETCFKHCVDSFNSRDLDKDEVECVEKCAHKLVRFNNRTIAVYANIQADLMAKRQEEMDAAEKVKLNESTSNDPVRSIEIDEDNKITS